MRVYERWRGVAMIGEWVIRVIRGEPRKRRLCERSELRYRVGCYTAALYLVALSQTGRSDRRN